MESCQPIDNGSRNDDKICNKEKRADVFQLAGGNEEAEEEKDEDVKKESEIQEGGQDTFSKCNVRNQFSQR